ncbi:FAD-dependent 5-carboxymethylaminomethyl-2-thiouridine(34) oxidoreductase MnmC [Castellaniella sp.]|uniref:FAD-dependent 5-carboxymethylaminomethyl-2-thiouridine(34) oxidoreductase MnmC n=1 Tax=Castellaniella sp. TaxID=1955812 RepID=UPI002B000A35|nr:FAD-dependent 5-carboxymethylaminomethyl-2-thiouridine(34) oxidoreductase MnmC [Castellaniella sp.]
MSGPYEPLTPAVWQENAQGVPCSTLFDDVYHGAAGPLAQAQQVFLRGNDLPARWRGQDAFTICETGFGLGQNFLAAWQAWRDDPQRSARLHYLSFEAHPFSLPDLRRAWVGLSAGLQPLADELAAQWPPLLPGLHQLTLQSGGLSLTLVFGDIRRTARQVQACVDAFFLDGFAPRVNPAMWSPALFGQLRRLARAGATAATWCAAGQVRRDLRDAGFLVNKVPGVAGKRDMTIAVLRPGLGQTPGPRRRQSVAVVGAGLAGAGLAQSLALRGHQVQVWDPLDIGRVPAAMRSRGAAALVPALSPDDDTRSRLSRVGLQRAWARWAGLAGNARPDPCGALVCAQSPQQALSQQQALARLGFPADWVRWLDAAQASRQAGIPIAYGGLWFAQALRVCPGELQAALLTSPGVQYRTGTVTELLPLSSGGWQFKSADGRLLGEADQVVLATARQTPALLARVAEISAWPVLSGLTPLVGQVSLYPVPADMPAVPRCVVSGQGYCLPPRQGWAVAGSTYRPHVSVAEVDEAGHRDILRRIGGWLPDAALPWLGAAAPEGWAGWRAATRDHLPIIDAVAQHPGLWLACAYGSRGLSWSALAGDLMAARLDDEPWPIERELQHRIRLR